MLNLKVDAFEPFIELPLLIHYQMLTQFARFRYCRSERLRSAHEDDDRKKLLNGANGANGSL